MNLIVIVMLVLGIFVLVDAWKAHSRLARVAQWKGYRTTTYRLNGKNYQLLIADTPEKQTQGLMNIRKIEGADGMMFTFASRDDRSFWNEHTLIDLDVYWLQGKKVVGQDFLPSVEKNNNVVVISSPSPVDTVIEIPHRN